MQTYTHINRTENNEKQTAIISIIITFVQHNTIEFIDRHRIKNNEIIINNLLTQTQNDTAELAFVSFQLLIIINTMFPCTKQSIKTISFQMESNELTISQRVNNATCMASLQSQFINYRRTLSDQKLLIFFYFFVLLSDLLFCRFDDFLLKWSN